MLFRYDRMGHEEDPLPAEDALDAFTDREDISDYALDALNWAVTQGIVNGMPENRIEPQGAANRAQAATMLYRYMIED